MKRIIFILVMIPWFAVFGQDDDFTIPKTEDLVKIPPSPEAFAYTKYGNTPVSLYTGSADINIPLHTIKGRNIEIPISLSYDASGVKVNQLATWVGLGWNLKAGGVVTRQVNGKPDDHFTALPEYQTYYESAIKSDFETYMNLTPAANQNYAVGLIADHHAFRTLQLEGKVETQPDTYSFNIMDLSGTLFIDYETETGYCQEHPDLKVEPILQTASPTYPNDSKLILGWHITDKFGTKYTFQNAEKTYQHDNGNSVMSYNSAWYISSIVTTNGQDTVNFNYTAPVAWQNAQYVGEIEVRSEELQITCGINPDIAPTPVEYKIEQFELSSIDVNGYTAAQFYSPVTFRSDLKGKKSLDYIEFKDPNGLIFKKVDLLNDTYFGVVDADDRKSRLKLSGVKIDGPTITSNAEEYTFEYHAGSMPSRASFARDYWGYFNGQNANDTKGLNNNGTLVPYLAQYDDVTATFMGANREPDLTYAKIGSLSKITYPTGGSSEFSYKLHRRPLNQFITYKQPYAAGNVILPGGTDGTDPYGYTSCDDFSSQKPVGIDYSFWLEESGPVTISLNVTGTAGSGSSGGVTYAAIYKTGEGCYVLPAGTICDMGTPSPFCDVFNDGTVPYEQYGNFLPGTALQHTVQLDSGYYHVVLLNSNSGTTMGLSVEAERTVTEHITAQDIGGLRTYKIQDYSANSTLAKTRYLIYDDLGSEDPQNITETFLEASNATTGVLHVPTYFEDYSSTMIKNISCKYHRRYSANLALAVSPHVSYSTVTELEFANGTFNGMSVHKFHNEQRATIGAPVSPVRPLNGKEYNKKVYELDGDSLKLRQETNTNYSYQFLMDGSGNNIGVSGYKLSSKEQHLIYMLIEPATIVSGTVTEEKFRYKRAFYGGVGADPAYQYCFEAEDSYVDNTCLHGPFGLEQRYVYGVNQYWLKQNQVDLKEIDNGGKIISTLTDYVFDSTDHFQVTEIKRTDSRGQELKTKLYYPRDDNMTFLLNKHRIGEVIRREVLKDNVKIWTKETEYTYPPQGPLNIIGDVGLPSKLKFATHLNIPEVRVSFDAYDDFHNPVTVTRNGGKPTAFIWGYDGTVPIAMVENSTYAAIKTTLGASELQLLEGTTLTESQIRTKIELLRTQLQDAQVTCYTHRPGIGISSVTDPNNITTYFYYDAQNRLHYSEDKDGNILDMYNYDVSQGYARSHKYLTPRTTLPTESASMALTNDLVSISTQFVDGLGRPSQTVAKEASFGNLDLIHHIEYDSFGREAKQFLPYTNGSTGEIKTYPLTGPNGQKAFHHTLFGGISGDYAFSENEFEQSPLNRVAKTYAPGQAWAKASGNKPVLTSYRTNIGTDQVRIWEISTSADPVTGLNGEYQNATIHGEGTLHVTEVTDENGYKTLEFKDKLGHVILKKVQETASTYLSTYYVYDDLNNLRYVLPPEAVKAGEANGNRISNTILNDFGFYYEYDGRNRMIEKKVPGAEKVEMVYDKFDRLVMTQDGNQKLLGEWTFTKYDQLDRPAITGTFKDDTVGHDRTYHQTQIDAMLIFNVAFNDEQANSIKEGVFIEASQHDGMSTTYRAEQYVELQSGFIYDSGVGGDFNADIQNPIPNIDGGWVDVYYDKTYPDIVHSEVLTINFYDNYNFTSETFSLPAGVFTAIDGELPSSTTAVKGQVTGTKTKILGTSDYITTVNFFDDKYQVTQVVTVNHKGGRDVLTSHYDFAGRLRKTHRDHYNQYADLTATTIVMNYTYDHGGRLLTVDHSINGETTKVIAENTYNELGELNGKKIGDATQQLDYKYNMRGWLTHINDPASTVDNDYFSMQLKYDDATTAQHNGNIGEIVWRDPFETDQKTYKYGYDYMNRLSAADYSTTSSSANAFQVHGITYDGNGNILTLQRKSKNTTIDNLDYDYVGNQLTKVTDASASTEGFKDGANQTTEYVYDANGNMIEDKNKGITSITYNHLNLPKKVTFDGSKYIEYTYDAAGVKLSQKVVDGSTTKVTDYIGGFIYEDDKLQLVQHDEGRITRENSAWDYQYHIKDHLGNVRTTFTPTPDPNDTYLATMEIENNSTESQYFSNLATAHVNLLANNTPNGNEAALLDNGAPIGPAIAIPVVPGDTLDIEVYGYYEGGSGYSSTAGLTGFTTALAGAFGGLNGGTAEQQSVYDGINDFLSGLGSLNGTGNDNVPAAYLNYILVDQDYNYVTAGWEQISGAASFNLEQISLSTGSVTKAGYVYIYVSMESNTTYGVFFDDLKVTHRHSNIVGMDNYYPFGLTFNSYQKTGNQTNNFKYNGKELVSDLDLGWYDYQARWYDPALGRWHAVDPAADLMRRHSPYNYAYDNPIRYIDPDGMFPTDPLFMKGFGNGVIKSIKGFGSFIAETYNTRGQNLVDAAVATTEFAVAAYNDPSTAAETIVEGAKNGFINSIVENGSISGAIGELTGEIAVGAVTSVVGDKGLSKIKTLSKISKVTSKVEVKEPVTDVLYKRPNNATTKAQRQSVQDKPCVDCGATGQKNVADHKTPLVKEHYQTGKIDKAKMKSLDAVQPQCSTCSSKQGATMSQYSKEMKKVIQNRTQ